MRIAITGGTGFLGRHIVERLAGSGHTLRCWHRPQSDDEGLAPWAEQIEFLRGELGNADSATELVTGCEAVVHAALDRPTRSFRGGEGDVLRFAERNVMGSLQLIESARLAGAQRFVFISSCAVHEKILDDRPLDETHPLWPASHYGAYKAAVEKFVHSYGLGHGFPICALRPTGIYGVTRPVEASKWYDIVEAVCRGDRVECRYGGKEVHAADVASAVEMLLNGPPEIAGQAYNCYDLYVSEYDVAHIAREIAGTRAEIVGEPKQPQHQIVTDKLRALGMSFGGRPLLEETIRQLVTYWRG